MIKKLLSVPKVTYLAFLIGIGIIMRFWDITQSSIWHDEGFTMMLAPMSVGEIIMRTARDVHPPLYYIVLHYWMLILGNSETAARGLSAAFMLATIPLTYFLVRRLWDERAARFGALFVTTGPFLIRYSQEARMYGMVAFLAVLSTYFLVLGTRSKRRLWWMLYGLTIAAALYTHYYSVFIIVVHWIYMLALTSRTKKSGLWDIHWWLSNVLAATAFLPWLPTAYAQFTRVQTSFWIPKVTIDTLPVTLLQFLAYGQGDFLSTGVKVGIGLLFVALIGVLFLRSRKHTASLVLLSGFALVGPVLVFALSYKRPIYVDRYFVFAAVAFYCLLGVMVAQLKDRFAVVATIGIFALVGLGVYNIHRAANWEMSKTGAYVNAHYQEGDAVLSGELYSFFDFSYYNHTGSPTLLWSKDGVNGYGESSLIYDRSDQIIVRRLQDLHPVTGIVWVVGKTGAKDYYDHVPSSWMPLGTKVVAGETAVQKFRVAPRSAAAVAVQ